MPCRCNLWVHSRWVRCFWRNELVNIHRVGSNRGRFADAKRCHDRIAIFSENILRILCHQLIIPRIDSCNSLSKFWIRPSVNCRRSIVAIAGSAKLEGTVFPSHINAILDYLHIVFANDRIVCNHRSITRAIKNTIFLHLDCVIIKHRPCFCYCLDDTFVIYNAI